jgi:hypothetical protein
MNKHDELLRSISALQDLMEHHENLRKHSSNVISNVQRKIFEISRNYKWEAKPTEQSGNFIDYSDVTWRETAQLVIDGIASGNDENKKGIIPSGVTPNLFSELKPDLSPKLQDDDPRKKPHRSGKVSD